MGCKQSHVPLVTDEAKARNDEIESQLKRDRIAAMNDINMLILDSGDSGKDILLRHMRLIHQGGYNDSERVSYKKIVFSNTIQSMRAVLEALSTLNIVLRPSNDSRKEYVLSHPMNFENEYLPLEIADAIRGLWLDPGVREAVTRSDEFGLDGSAMYFFNAIDRMGTPGYLPTDQDILRSRVQTTGIAETAFRVGELTYSIFDVGPGQQGSRKKWIHCFENVTALIFVVSLSDYDQMSPDNVNRLQEAMTFFDSICNSRWFVKTSIILLLNNIDIFAEKLSRSPLGDYFSDYTGGDNYDAACDYLLHRFVSLNQNAATKQIFAHYTCTSDTQQVKFVLSVIQDILLQREIFKGKR